MTAQAATGYATPAWLCPECHHHEPRWLGDEAAPTCPKWNDPDDPENVCGTRLVPAFLEVRETVTEVADVHAGLSPVLSPVGSTDDGTAAETAAGRETAGDDVGTVGTG